MKPKAGDRLTWGALVGTVVDVHADKVHVSVKPDLVPRHTHGLGTQPVDCQTCTRLVRWRIDECKAVPK